MMNKRTSSSPLLSVTSIFCAALLLFSTSCATLIHGPKTSVKVRSNVDEARVSLTDRASTYGMNEPFKIKGSPDDQYLSVDAEGYEKERYLLESKVNWYTYLNYGWSAAATTALIVLAPEQINTLTLLISLNIGSLITAAEAATGSMFRYQSDVEVDLVQMPDEFDSEKTRELFVDRIEYNQEEGTEIGMESTGKRGKFPVMLGYSLDTDESYTRSKLNEKLPEVGIKLPFSERNSEVINNYDGYKIDILVNDISYDREYVGFPTLVSKCTMDVTYKLQRPRSKEAAFVHTMKIETSAQGDNEEALYKAFRKGLYEFLDQEEFRRLMSTDTKLSMKIDPAMAYDGPMDIQAEFASRSGSTKGSAEVIKDVEGGVVTVSNEDRTGSGFLVSTKGFILTSARMVEGADEIKVLLSNGVEVDAKIAHVDVTRDVAIIKVPEMDHQALKISTVDPMIGEEVIVIGNSGMEGLELSTSKGLLSGKRKIEERTLLQTDAKVNSGNFGGPMLDGYGNVVGLITTKLVGGGVEGLAFAVLALMLAEVLNEVERDTQ